jgi:ribosome-associated protein
MECTGDYFPSPATRPNFRHRIARIQPRLAPPLHDEAEARHSPIRGVTLADPAHAPTAASIKPVDVEALHSLVMQSLDDDQAVEVVTIPLAGKSSIADHMVIASGRSSRQVASMANKLAEKIKKEFGRIVRIEGLPVADWVLIDADDVIVHLFRPEVRSFYNLERMWAFGDDAGITAASRG